MKIIYNDGTVAECPKEEELHVLRHTAAHIMAQAIKRLYPEADFGYGPATENGFYYDVDLGDTKLTDEDLANIEKEMRKITKENLPIKAFILPRPETFHLLTFHTDLLLTFLHQPDVFPPVQLAPLHVRILLGYLVPLLFAFC